MFGQEAFEVRNFLQITQPMERGIVKNCFRREAEDQPSRAEDYAHRHTI